MHNTRGRAATIALAVGGGLAATTGVGPGTADAHPAAHPAAREARQPPAAIVATITKDAITLSSGNEFQAGRVYFQVTTTLKHGDHTLQIVRLHPGYTKAEFDRDLADGIQTSQPDVKAVKRLDHRATWLGGATSRHGKTRQFGVDLPPGKYFLFDQSGAGATKVKVTRPTVHRPRLTRDVTVKGTSTDRWVMPRVLPAKGWIRLKNTSDEAHFFALVQVKKSTTKAKVRRFIKGGESGNPRWIKTRHTSSGVFSRHTNVVFQTHLHRGKYLVGCFWPSDETGMDHFSMGMWKLVHLN